MEKIFRHENGTEVVARDEVQAAAYKSDGFKEVKGAAAKKNAMDSEFAQEMGMFASTPQEQAAASREAGIQAHAAEANAQANATNANMTEFSQELGAMSAAEMNAAEAKAAGKTAAPRTNKTNK